MCLHIMLFRSAIHLPCNVGYTINNTILFRDIYEEFQGVLITMCSMYNLHVEAF